MVLFIFYLIRVWLFYSRRFQVYMLVLFFDSIQVYFDDINITNESILNFYRLDDCSPMENDRHCASLLKSNNLQPSPIYTPRHKVTRRPSPPGDSTDSPVSLAKVTTIPRCRNSIISNIIETPQLTSSSLSAENPHVMAPSSVTFAAIPIIIDDTKMTSFSHSTSVSNVSYSDSESRKHSCRLPLEVVPELSELNVANNRYSFPLSASSTVHNSHHSHSVQPSPVLITFDSNSLKRRS